MQNKWYEKTVEETTQLLIGTSHRGKSFEEMGLSAEQVDIQREKYGMNALEEKKKKSLFSKFIDQFKDFMIIVLIIAAIISGVVGVMEGEGFMDSIIILGVVILNAIIGVVQEANAEKSLEALKKMSSYSAKVIRNGQIAVVPSSELVVGDIVVLDTGDYIPADLRIIEAVNLKAQEAALTGESVPVEKKQDVLKGDIAVADRVNMLFSSSLVTYGRGKGIVVETGMSTEVGKIAKALNEVEATETPLQQKLNKLGKTLGIAALAICLVIFLVGSIVHGKDLMEMFMTAVSLAVAAIPEGLPAIATIVLAVGVRKMVKKHAIVKTLPAVETLGSATVICSDKTGTLTQNKMTVEKVYYNETIFDVENIPENDDTLTKLISCAMLCNDTKINEETKELTGDPTETALIDLGFKLDVGHILSKHRESELPFDSDRKLMTTVHKHEGKYIVYTKGATDELLRKCKSIQANDDVKSLGEEDIIRINLNNEDMAKNALRVLGFAYKIIELLPDDLQSLESELTFVGMVGMIDPARPECKDAVCKCKTAGIKPVMITGDHKITAVAIAKQLGILEENDNEGAITGAEIEKMSQEVLIQKVPYISVYARVSPEHKVRIVRAWQARGEVVAMTGDGVNDAPSLKQADIGVAMGIMGTDVSKEASDVILTDDNFATIVSAVEEGRRIYSNILKAITYLLATNVAEIIVLFVAVMLGWDAPLLPVHLLMINLVTDSLPAIALSFDPAEDDIMEKKPRKSKSIFTKSVTYRVLYQGVMVAILTLIAYAIGENTSHEVGQTMAFTVLAFLELVHVFNVRSDTKTAFKNMFSNKILWGAITLSALIMIVILGIPGLENIFSVVTFSKMGAANLLEMALLILAPLAIVEIMKLLKINTIGKE